MSTVPQIMTTIGKGEPAHPKNVITTKDRKQQLVKLVVIALVAIATVVLTCIDVSQTTALYQKKAQLSHKVEGSIETAKMIHELQRERGITALMLELNMVDSVSLLVEQDLMQCRKEATKTILQVKQWTNISDSFTKAAFLKYLNEYRSKIDREKDNITIASQLRKYSGWIREFVSWLPRYTESENLEDFADLVFAYQMLIHSKEETGLGRALGGLWFLQGQNFTSENKRWYNKKINKADWYLTTALSFSSEIDNSYKNLVENQEATWIMARSAYLKDVLRTGNVNSSKDTALEWFEIMSNYSNLLLQLQVQDANRIQEVLQQKIQFATKWLVYRFLLLIFTAIIVPLIILSLVRVQNAFYRYTLSLYDKIGLEQGRTEFLMMENARHVENLATRWKTFSGKPVENGNPK